MELLNIKTKGYKNTDKRVESFLLEHFEGQWGDKTDVTIQNEDYYYIIGLLEEIEDDDDIEIKKVLKTLKTDFEENTDLVIIYNNTSEK